MSEVGPGTLIKLAYRGIAGFFVLLFMFITGVLGFTFSLAGGLITVLCWVPIAWRIREKTIASRVKEVIMIRMAGAS